MGRAGRPALADTGGKAHPRGAGALAIFREDARARALLGERLWGVGEFSEGGEWYTCEGDGGGRVIDIDLEKEMDVERFEWPVLVDDCDGQPYGSEPRCHSAENVTELIFRVDLARRRVVDIAPAGEELLLDGREPRALSSFADYPPGC